MIVNIKKKMESEDSIFYSGKIKLIKTGYTR